MKKDLRVLMVEDSAADAELILHQLNETGCHLEYELVDTAHDTRRALGEKQWDVILCDYSMPKLDPYRVLDILRETELDIPLIVISGKIGEDNAIKLLKAGCHDCIMKSDLRRLPDVINRERKEAIVREENRMLNKKLQKYQILCDAAKDMMLFIDTAGNILDVNAAAIKFYGYSIEEFLTKSILDLRHVSNKELVMTQMEAAITDNIVFETIHYRKDNTPFFAEVSTQGILMNGQNILFSIVRDITERKQNEQQLEQYMKDMLESQHIAHIGTWSLDIETNHVVWSDELYRMYGFDPSKTPPPYTEHMKLFTPESWEKLSTALEITRTAGIPYELELETKKADGSNGWMWVRGEANKDSKGNIFSLWGAAQDITMHKRDEIELIHERNMAQMYLDTAGVVIMVLDRDGKINLINREGCEILKVAREDVLGKDWFGNYMPDSAQKDEKQFFDNIFECGAKTEQYHENSIILVNGEERRILWYYNPLQDTAGNTIGLVCSGTDITERKQSEARIVHLASFPKLNPEPIIELNQDGSINYANPVAKNIFPDLESVGACHPFLLNWQTILTQLSAQGYDTLMHEIMVGGRFYSQTFQYIESSRSIRIYGQDITRRKQIENALVESEKLFRTSFESATIGIVMYGKNGMFTKVNDRACEIWGYTREELLQLRFNDITYAEDQGIGTDFVNKMISGELDHASFEKRYIKKDGTVVWALISVSAIRDETNNFKYFINYIQDITDSKAFTERINGVLEGTIETLALVVEARDPYTSGHQKRVAEVAVAIAENLGLSKERVRGLFLASIIHDLGKIQVPSEILSKPGKLSNLEFELIKCHPETAYHLLKDIDFPWPIAEIIYQHHEKIDGSGYPRRLKGDSMLVEAKILCVADVYEAMSSHRPYRSAFTKDIALAEIEKNKGILFDADVVEACLEVLKDR